MSDSARETRRDEDRERERVRKGRVRHAGRGTEKTS